MNLAALFSRLMPYGIAPQSLHSLCCILLCLCVDGVGLLYMEQQLAQAVQLEQHAQQLAQQLATAERLQPSALATQQQLVRWQRLGLLTQPTPAQWDQRMQALQQQYQLPHLNYALTPQQPASIGTKVAEAIAAALASAALNTRLTQLEISLTNANEQAMEQWLVAMQHAFPVGWQPVRCHWQMLSDARSIEAGCHLLWVSFLT